MRQFQFNYNIVKAGFLALLLFFLASPDSFAQRKSWGNKSSITGKKFKSPNKFKRKKPRNYINSIKAVGQINTTKYYGDLANNSITLRPGVGFGLQYRINESLAARTNVAWNRLAGSDKGSDYEFRNLSFRSDLFEWTAEIVYDILEYNKMFRRRHLVSPYLYMGIGFGFFNPQAELDGTWYSLQPLQTEGVGYKRSTFLIPYGLGATFKVNPHLDVSLQAGNYLTFTDYLDDVSGNYDPTKNALPSDDISRQLADRRQEYLEIPGNTSTARNSTSIIRGNPDKNDGYFGFSVKVEYTIKVSHQTYNINSNVSRFRTIKSVKKK